MTIIGSQSGEKILSTSISAKLTSFRFSVFPFSLLLLTTVQHEVSYKGNRDVEFRLASVLGGDVRKNHLQMMLNP